MTEELTYVRGDATAPRSREPRIIAHVCDDRGGWRKGFVLALSRRWPESRNARPATGTAHARPTTSPWAPSDWSRSSAFSGSPT
ncbi:hypothetical protein GA0115246_1088310 [Streptomyces sp. SolWspMP-sol7th]|nr:hypothetical protein GA0115246_1088310 [Streptomyces sp. SolWspMP-sol7th]